MAPTTTATATAVIAYSGNDIIDSSDPTVDLDSPTDGTEGDNIGDLVHTASALTTSSGSRIAPLDRAQIPSPEVCRSALDERGLDTVPVTQIEQGLSLCIRTTADRIGAIRLIFVRKVSEASKLSFVHFDYMVWDTTPE